ncbi:MAG: adenylate/guanylate cyclase domain-containing protein [Alphaproteobacteria bacterium]
MAGERADTSFELFVLGRRGWELLARYPDRDRAGAYAYAKSLEEQGKAAKIVREVFVAATNQSEENTVYLSRNLIEAQAALARSAPSAGRRGGVYDDYTTPAGGTSSAAGGGKGFAPIVRGPKSGVDLMFRAVGIGLTSLVVAGFATVLASMVLGQMSTMGYGVSSSSYSTTQFAVFLGTFTLTSIPLLLAFIGLSDAPNAGSVRNSQSSGPSWWERFSLTRDSDLALGLGGRGDGDKDAVILDLSQPLPLEAEKAAEKEAALEPVPEPEPTLDPLSVLQQQLAEAEQAEKAEQEKQSLEGPSMEKGRAAIMKFAGGALSALKGAQAQLDPYSKFGADLMIAGAADAIANERKLEGAQRRKLLQETLEVLGTKRNLAQSFCDKLEEYLQTPRYLAMIQAGSNAMHRVLENGDAPYDDLLHAMKDWNAPTSTSATPSIITVMFTDMVGSTNITQTRGDDSAQILVRTHNTIVRAALRDFAGREIKHTGDGIMASFNSASNAVEATVAIQRAVLSQPKELGLRLRIGLNAGEPIQEENDLFGTTVQLAARICAKADQDQIFVSNVVRELSSGKQLRFAPKGLFELKGVTEPQPLYEVLWQDSAGAAAGGGGGGGDSDPAVDAAHMPLSAARAQRAATQQPAAVAVAVAEAGAGARPPSLAAKVAATQQALSGRQPGRAGENGKS